MSGEFYPIVAELFGKGHSDTELFDLWNGDGRALLKTNQMMISKPYFTLPSVILHRIVVRASV